MDSKTAATADDLGELHKMLTAQAKLLMESEDPKEQAEGRKLAMQLLDASKITAITGDLLPVADKPTFKDAQKRRFADAKQIADLAEERARRAANDT